MPQLIVVFVPKGQPLPVAQKWSAAAAAAGFELEIGGRFSPQLHEGALPVTCRGIEAAFEYYCDSIDDYFGETGHEFSWFLKWRLRQSACAVQFLTHASEEDLVASIIASAAFARAVNGQLLDTQAWKLMSSEESLQWAREHARLKPVLN